VTKIKFWTVRCASYLFTCFCFFQSSKLLSFYLSFTEIIFHLNCINPIFGGEKIWNCIKLSSYQFVFRFDSIKIVSLFNSIYVLALLQTPRQETNHKERDERRNKVNFLFRRMRWIRKEDVKVPERWKQ